MIRTRLQHAAAFVVIFLGLFLAFNNPVTLQAIDDEESPPPVVIPLSEERILPSAIVGHDYRLWIALPLSYESSDQSYPVLYLLDADATFRMVTDIMRVGAYSGEYPELIIVGISYSIEYAEPTELRRMLDYRMEDQILSPDLFLRFIREELIPFMDARYRTDSRDRGVAGFANAGNFALYTLVHEPRTFSRYIVGSATDYHRAAQEDLITQRSYLPINIFLSIDATDGHMSEMSEFCRCFAESDVMGMKFKSEIVNIDTGVVVYPIHIARGLHVVYSDD